METGGISARLVRFAASLVGHFQGGLGMVCVVSSMIFAGISGSSAADASAIGGILIPAMARRGYSRPYAASLQAAAATMGPIIPPSVLMVVYGSLANVSIGAMFLGGLVPGVLVGLGLMLGNYWWARRLGYPAEESASWGQVWTSFREAVWALIIPVVIVGGILSGVFTATEAGAVASVYAFIVAMLIYRELRLGQVWGVIVRSVVATAQVMIIIAAAGIFGWLLAARQFPTLAVEFLLSLTSDPRVVILLIIGFLLVLGCVMEILAAAIILIPVLFPVAERYGFDPVHFAVVMVIAMVLGSITPPVGVTLYLCLGIANTTIMAVNRYIWSFVAVIVAVLLLVTFVPELVLAVPRWFMR
jgi:C4-dicarboxylate transporter DctM subunit